MKRFEPAAYVVAILMFVFAGISPPTPAQAQTASCPGGTIVLCGTSSEKECIQVNYPTGTCTAWRESTRYYYHAPEGHSCGDRICQT
jgi:hypothetical protein